MSVTATIFRCVLLLNAVLATAAASKPSNQSTSHPANEFKAGRKKGPQQHCAGDDETCSFRQWSTPCCNPKATCTYYRYAGLNISFAANTRNAYCRMRGTLVKGSMVLAPARGAASFLEAEAVDHDHVWVSSLRAVEEAIAEAANATHLETSDVVARLSHQQGPTPHEDPLLVAGFVLMAVPARAVELSAILAKAGATGIEVALNRKLVSFGLDYQYGKVKVTNMTMDIQKSWGLPRGYEGKYSVPLVARPYGASDTGGAVFLAKMSALASLVAVAVAAVSAAALVWLRRRSRCGPAFTRLQTEQY